MKHNHKVSLEHVWTEEEIEDINWRAIAEHDYYNGRTMKDAICSFADAYLRKRFFLAEGYAHLCAMKLKHAD